MRQYFAQRWQALTIRKKILSFTGVVFVICLLSISFDVWVVKFSLVDFNHILEDNAESVSLVQALENESVYFTNYIKGQEDVTLESLEKVMEKTVEAMNEMPYDYSAIGETRYAKTWAIHNCYDSYREKRDAFLEKEKTSPTYINDLYTLYDMQDYLIKYAKELMTDTIETGSEDYWDKVPKLLSVPGIVIAFGCCLLLVMIKLSGLMNKTIVSPVMKLVTASKRIADNDFFVEDVPVENQDELGELVHAFNKMKYATGEYIMALEEKRKTLDLLHEEELEKLEVENRLEVMKLELLKSQVNPHFLFNTLNVIGGMANLEGAETTETMIKAMSSLFRYNLKTSDIEVPLNREMKVVEDYMYLQQMRFGDRITYDMICNADSEHVLVPAFTFQPLVENAIIHGLSKKEEGGKIRIRIMQQDRLLFVYIGDNGIGINPQDLQELRSNLQSRNGKEEIPLGIGVGNIYRRIYTMYPKDTLDPTDTLTLQQNGNMNQGGAMEIYSKKNAGTVVKLIIPQRGGEYVSSTDSGRRAD